MAKKNTFKIALLLFIIISCILIGVFLWFNQAAGGIPDTGAEFEIKKGDSGNSVSQRLFIKGYIKSKLLFKAVVRILSLDKKLKSGWIKIDKNDSLSEIIYNIYTGNFITVSFTIPEGADLKMITNILAGKGIVSNQDIIDFSSDINNIKDIGLEEYGGIEGFLYPETYKFYKGTEVKTIFKAMVKLFFEKVSVIYPEYKSLSKKDFYDKIILASIIEKEVRVPEEAKIVAAVFNNRINKRMKLQSCATVQYILDKPREQLLESDLLIKHPYNTYIYYDLPPGPISNPGYNSLKAAFYPDKNDYLYFVVKDPDIGSHHFSTTYADHLNAKEKYKKLKGFQ